MVVKSGRATFKADLRVRVQAGAEAQADIFGIGAGAVMGVYVNLIEFVAVLETTPTCELQAREWWDLNVGAYASLGVVVDFKTTGLVPTVSTTLLSAPTLTQCLLSGTGGGAGGSAALPTLTTEILSLAPPPVQSLSGDTPTFPVFTPTVIAFAPIASADASEKSGSSSTTTFKYPLGNSTNSSYPLTAAGSRGASHVASALQTTATYSLIRCAADVVNCPPSYQSLVVVTRTAAVPADTTCTAGASAASSTRTAATTVPAVHVVTDVVVLVPCATPFIETFVEPSLLVPTQSAVAVTFPAAVLPTTGFPAATFPAATFPAVAPFVGGAAKDVIAVPVLSSAPAPQVTVRPSAAYTPSGSPGGKPVTAGAAGREAGSFCAAVVAVAGLLAVL